jgi:hypothetical protein
MVTTVVCFLLGGVYLAFISSKQGSLIPAWVVKYITLPALVSSRHQVPLPYSKKACKSCYMIYLVLMIRRLRICTISKSVTFHKFLHCPQRHSLLRSLQERLAGYLQYLVCINTTGDIFICCQSYRRSLHRQFGSCNSLRRAQ